MKPPISVRLEDFSAQEFDALEEVLLATGLPIEMPDRPNPWGQNAAYYSWVVEVAAPLAPFVVAFVGQLGKRSADDFYDGLEHLVKATWGVKGHGMDPSDRGRLTIKDIEIEGRVINIVGSPPTDDEIDSARQLGFESRTQPGCLEWYTQSSSTRAFRLIEQDREQQ